MDDVWGKVTYHLRFTAWCKKCNGHFMSTNYRISKDFKKAARGKRWKEIDGEWHCPKCARGLDVSSRK
jgi:hypothetical protein